jgi:hypothetical protein
MSISAAPLLLDIEGAMSVAYQSIEHKLDCLKISVSASSDHAERVAEECSRLFHRRLRPLISTVLDRVHQEHGDLLIADPLTLDLGDLPLSDLENRFYQRLEQRLLEWLLRNAKSMTRPPAAAIATAPVNDPTDALTQFNHYLSRGKWPTTERWAGAGRLDTWLLKQLVAQPRRYLVSLATHCLQPEALRRLYLVLQATTLIRLCRYLVPLQTLTEPITPWTLKLCALRYFQQHPQCAMPSFREGEQPFVPDSNEYLVVTLFSGYDIASPALNTWLKALWHQPPVRDILKRRLTSPVFQRLEARLYAVRGEQGAAADKSLAISIGNGGITLLWPLLPGLFEQLGLLEGKRFLHRQAQLNAVCWLDELIWADGEYAEWRMPLNKLLCGLPLDTRLEWTPPDSVATEVMRHWLSTLTERLPGWKRLGPEDIRQLFLQRPAWLVPANGSFTLYIQPEVYDVLLNDWPWPKNVLMLPWLMQPLTIDWCKPPIEPDGA